NRPVHLFGCGHPMLFAQAALLGCDFFDSASYVKFAESGRMLLPDGTVHLKDLKELPCECPVCSQTTAEALKKLGTSEKETELMKHNLYVSAFSGGNTKGQASNSRSETVRACSNSSSWASKTL
ncbi:MAG: tRNA-guanine transglycosylase, partial [Candidatus Thorarchaeota archaeon]